MTALSLPRSPFHKRAERRKRRAGAGERLAREARVLVHAGDEILDLRELGLGPDPAEKGDVDRRAVEFAGEIEQMHFEQRRPIIERRAAAEARDAVADLAMNAGADRVDAVLEPALGVELEVGGGIPEPVIVPVTNQGWPISSAASITRPAASAARIEPEETGRPSSSSGGRISTAKPSRSPSAAKKPGEPRRSLP